MIINLNVKVKVGPRTETSVEVYSTAVNKKVAILPNGAKVSDEVIADWIEENLLAALQRRGE